jgi:hypothetical protein
VPQLAQAREIVGFSDPYSSGTVVVKTSARALYYVPAGGDPCPQIAKSATQTIPIVFNTLLFLLPVAKASLRR